MFGGLLSSFRFEDEFPRIILFLDITYTSVLLKIVTVDEFSITLLAERLLLDRQVNKGSCNNFLNRSNCTNVEIDGKCINMGLSSRV